MKNVKFYLMDETTNDIYWFETKFTNNDDFYDFIDSSEFEIFMEKMECSSEKWSGVHDFGGYDDDNIMGYSSYEIKEYDTAIKMWFDFFKKYDLLSENSEVKISLSFGDLKKI